MRTFEIINLVLTVLFFLNYTYQFFYVPVSWFGRTKPHKETKLHTLGILIAARNEAAVIGQLIDSVKAQDYPADRVRIYLCADNCTDRTAAIARRKGAVVYERRDPEHVGKGYALNFLLGRIARRRETPCDAFVVLDADNILAPNYLTELNKTYSDGYEIVTSYRNSKNYGDNWISAGYALWFLREARYLNRPRCLLGTSCAVSGTGFLFSRRVLEDCGGWNFFLLTEDIEFTIANVTRGVKVGYCGTAELYDEQPTSFRQSWRQRVRWSRGYMQVFRKYGGQLLKGILHGSFSCFDMTMNIMPAAVLSAVSIVSNLTAAILSFRNGGDMAALGWSVAQLALNVCLTVFVLGAITTVTEWKHIHCSTFKKILYLFTFPLFMLTYIPVCLASFFGKVGWKPIEHKRALTLEEISGKAG